jgi:hypothetical protein
LSTELSFWSLLKLNKKPNFLKKSATRVPMHVVTRNLNPF